jgi:hypothetical protein
MQSTARVAGQSPTTLHRRSPSFINHTPRTFEIPTKSKNLPRSHHQRPASSCEVWTLSPPHSRNRMEAEEFLTEETISHRNSTSKSSGTSPTALGPKRVLVNTMGGDDAASEPKISQSVNQELSVEETEDELGIDSPLFPPLTRQGGRFREARPTETHHSRIQTRSPVLPRSNASMEMAYFLRHTGPPSSESPVRRLEPVAVRKKRHRDQHRGAFRLLGYGRRSNSSR